jgi:hypothetical protein
MIVVGTTLAAFVMDQEDSWGSWMKNAEAVREEYQRFGNFSDVKYFAAIQIDARGIEPFKPFIEKLESIGGEYWTYSLDDGRTKVNMFNRLRHITVGQNIVVDYAQSHADCTHLLFMAADCMPPDDIMPRMLEMNHPLVAPYITTYGLRGPKVDKYDYPVMDAMASAAAIFIARDVFTKIRWRWDLDTNMSDDPCYHHDAKTLLGIPTYVRTDVLAKHFPESVGAYEFRGHNLDVIR